MVQDGGTTWGATMLVYTVVEIHHLITMLSTCGSTAVVSL
jgi:hypothetical protein